MELITKIFNYPVIIIVFIIDILLVIFYKRIIGMAGEYWVKKELNKLDKNKYLIINDLMIKTKDDKSHQVDHLVISRYGIFVIETKQYNGYIKGNDYDKTWSIKAGNKRFNINNPVHQNYGHIKALEEVLGLDNEMFINIVCISSRATLNIKSDSVVEVFKLIEKINSYDKDIINNYEVIYNKIKSLNITDTKERKEHIKCAKEIKKNKEISLENKCPKCGGNLVKRTGKYGEFIGCSNYPKCKYTKR